MNSALQLGELLGPVAGAVTTDYLGYYAAYSILGFSSMAVGVLSLGLLKKKVKVEAKAEEGLLDG